MPLPGPPAILKINLGFYEVSTNKENIPAEKDPPPPKRTCITASE